VFKNYQDSQNLVTFNQVKKVETGHSRLILRDIWYSNEQLYAVRPSQDNNFFCLSHNGDIWNVRRGIIENREISDSDLRETGESFLCGEKVNINVSNLEWNSQPLYLWERDSISPLNISPQNYEPFYPQDDGISLSFDMITSLSMSREKQEIAIGTRGGVCIFPYNNNGKEILALSQLGQILFFNEADDPDNWVEVKSVRYDRQRKLWAKFGQNKQSAAKLVNASDWDISSDRWPAEYANIQDYKINLDGDGFEGDGELYKKSNDSWWIGRKQLSDIVDFAIDDDCRTLWIVIRTGGTKPLLNATEGHMNLMITDKFSESKKYSPLQGLLISHQSAPVNLIPCREDDVKRLDLR